MSVTLRQLAQKLNVSPSTVSRALAGETGVGDARAAEIRAFAASLGYRPRPMRRGMNRMVGFVTVTPDGHVSDAPYQMRLLASAMGVASAAGWHLLHEFAVRDADTLPSFVRENRVDGVLLSGLPSPGLCEELRRLAVPAVALNDTAARSGLPSVMADGADGTRELVASLVAAGHRRLAFAATSIAFPTVAARVEAFRAATKAAKVSARVVITNWTTIQQGQVATRQILARRPHPTAILYSTDRLAVGGLIELARLGISVPGDMSIAAHDNTGLCHSTDPTITTVDLHQDEMVETAFATLRAWIESGVEPEATQTNIPATVRWRASCAGAL